MADLLCFDASHCKYRITGWPLVVATAQSVLQTSLFFKKQKEILIHTKKVWSLGVKMLDIN